MAMRMTLGASFRLNGDDNLPLFEERERQQRELKSRFRPSLPARQCALPPNAAPTGNGTFLDQGW
jgi:hypothetical protein